MPGNKCARLVSKQIICKNVEKCPPNVPISSIVRYIVAWYNTGYNLIPRLVQVRV